MPSHLLLPEGYTLSSLQPNDPPPAPAESSLGVCSQHIVPDLYMEHKGIPWTECLGVFVCCVRVLKQRNAGLKGDAKRFYSSSASAPDVDMLGKNCDWRGENITYSQLA